MSNGGRSMAVNDVDDDDDDYYYYYSLTFNIVIVLSVDLVL